MLDYTELVLRICRGGTTLIVRNSITVCTLLALATSFAPAKADDTETAQALSLRLVMPASAPSAATVGPQLKSAPAPPARSVSVIEQRKIQGRPQQQRSPSLSEDQLVVVGLDASEHEIARTIIPDPRLVRAEGIGPKGQMTGQKLYLEVVDFPLVLPDDPRIVAIQVFQPRWTGTDFVLELVGSTQIP